MLRLIATDARLCFIRSTNSEALLVFLHGFSDDCTPGVPKPVGRLLYVDRK